MAIDLTRTDEPKLNLKQAAGYFASARGDKPAHITRVLRYITKGCLGPDGRRVYLAALRQGSTWTTTPASIQTFCEQLTPKPGSTPVAPRTPSKRRREIERADRELAVAGR